MSRDKADLLVFSFISTDRKIGIKMCHVFKAASRVSLINSLGKYDQYDRSIWASTWGKIKVKNWGRVILSCTGA